MKIILLILTLTGNAVCNAQKRDTIKVIMLTSDTAFSLKTGKIKTDYQYGYSVRELHSTGEGQTDRELTRLYTNGNYVAGENEYWVHLYYLGSNKLPLPKSLVVWQSISF